MNIYDIKGNKKLSVLVTRQAKHEQELMKSDFVQLSWHSNTKTDLEVGSFIVPFDDGVKYRILDPYTPKQEKENHFAYTPQFHHPIMVLDRIPFILATGNTSSFRSADKETDWVYTGTASTILNRFVEYINIIGAEMPDIGTGWVLIIDGDITGTKTCTFSSVSVMGGISECANQWECEYHFDYENRILYFGKVIIGDAIVLKVGENVGVPSISNTTKQYYNAYIVKGSTRNISQKSSSGGNVSVNKRLTLDPVKYPYGYIDFREDGSEPIMIGELIYDDIYPSLELYVYDVRCRTRKLLDEEGNVVTDINGNVQTYAVWYVRLAYNSNGTWKDYEITDDQLIDGLELSMSFLANEKNGALPSPLAGLDFALAYHKTAEYIPESENGDSGVTIKAGDYEIIFKDGNPIIPTTRESELYPRGEESPSLNCNKVVLFNIAMSEEYKQQAYLELERTGMKEIQKLRSDLNNYTFPSNPVVFENPRTKPNLTIGQKVTYDDGHGYTLNTRVLKLVTQIDKPYQQTITVGNEMLKGLNTELREDLQRIMTGGGSGSGGGSLNVSELKNLLATYGKLFFLSKKNDDYTPHSLGVGGDLDVEGDINGKNANLESVTSPEYTGQGMLDTGFRLWYENGRSKLVIDDLVARGKFTVNELESRIWTHVGGNTIFSAAGSVIFMVEYLDENDMPLGHTYINSPWLLNGRMLTAGVTGLVAWSKRKAIQRKLTDTQKDHVKKFRCYLFSDNGTTQTQNRWKVGDLARCQTLNHVKDKFASDGSYSGSISNTVYWRRVVGIGSKTIDIVNDGKYYDYFDLSNVLDLGDDVPGYDINYNDWPAAGDNVVQFGSKDVARQGMVTIEVEGDENQATGSEIGLKVYSGVNNYSLAGCKWVGIGYDPKTERAFAEIYGDCYIGARGTVNPHDGSSYIRYNSVSKLLEIKARISLQSTFGSSSNDEVTLSDYIRSVTWTRSEIESMVGDGVSEVQKQLDGNFTIYYGQGEPTNSNYPAEDWNTTQKKKEHVYDLYWDRTNKNGYRWVKTVNQDVVTYGWDQIGDSSILAALAAAADAQDTADGKRRVFLNTPVPPYDQGDLWAQGANGDIMRCVMAKTKNQQYAESDWSKASKYTDDSSLNNFVNVTYNEDLARLHKQIDGKIETFFTKNDPSSSWTTAQKENHVDDVWFNTDSERLFRYKKNVNGNTTTYSWDEIFDEVALTAYRDAAKAQDTADGKRRVFVAQPTNADEYDVGDLWVNATYGTTYSNELLRCKTAKESGTAFDISHWEKASKYTDDSALTDFINGAYKTFRENIESQIDKKAETWYQSSDPASSWTTDGAKAKHVGDIWMDTSANGGKKTYIYQDKGENASPRYKWEAQNVPDSVFDKIDGKANIYVTWNAWGDELHVRDLYIPSANKTAGGVTYYKDKVYRCTNATTPTFAEIGYTDDSALSNFIANRYANDLINLNSSISTAKGTANSAASVAGNAQAAANALAYVKSALGATTDIDGGLMLTTLIALRNKNADNTYTTWGGINGAYQNGNTIAAWFGGGMVDHERTPNASNYAKILFRMNGSGYMAGGKFSWDENGNATIGGFEIGTDQLGAIDYNFEEGWAFIQRDGYFSVNKLNAARTYAAEIYGGAAIYAGVGIGGNDNDNYIKVNSNGVYIHGTVYINSAANSLKAYYHSDELGTGGGGSTSVAWSDITGKPSTFTPSSHKHDDRYKISNGTITLGSNSITPLTSHQSLSGYAQTSWVQNQGYATTSWVDTNYLSKGGGTLKGNIQLKPENSNYGCYIVFGDRPAAGSQDYAYIGENSDDHMVLYGRRGVLVQAGGANGASDRLILESLVEGNVSGIDIACSGDSILNLQSKGTNYGRIELSTAHGVSMYSTNERVAFTLQDWGSDYWVELRTTGGDIIINPSTGSTEIYKLVNMSDIRKKNVLEYKEYSVELFARAPLFGFTWKEGSDRREHIGTSAQYWQPLIPETVSRITDHSKDGRTIIGEHLSLDYISVTYAGMVTLAREVMSLREEISKLKQCINN